MPIHLVDNSVPRPPAVRVKRPSISLDNIFNVSIRTRLKWLLIFSIPVLVAFCSHNLPWISLAFATVAGFLANEVIPDFGRLLAHAGRVGKDFHKMQSPIIPESLGIAVGTVYLLVMFMFIPIPFMPWLLHKPASLFPFEQLGNYTAALLSITCMLFLGFADDILNLKWRHKILIPALSSLPLLMIYSVTTGRTEVVVPLPLYSLLGPTVDLGIFYYLYMSMLAIFCTHSINILAGVNGVEVGQSVIIAISVAAHNILALTRENESLVEHYFSLTLILPFLAVSMALLHHNWWPASVFVGDTYCYFAGMTFAVVGILGHFGKTLLLFFLPQIFNFFYSTPQLFGLVPCPRHRLPTFNHTTGLLEPSKVTFFLNGRNRALVRWLVRLRLLRVYQQTKEEITVNNFTILNLLLVLFGPLREDYLAALLMKTQTLCSILAFIVRHYLANYIFPKTLR